MSAFIASPWTMDRCVRAICGQHKDGRVRDEFLGIALNRKDTKKKDPEFTPETRAGRALYAMNIAAVRERYPDSPPDAPSLKEAQTYLFHGQPYDKESPEYLWAGSVKALDCLLYQCSEGDIPSSSAYGQLKKIPSAICNMLVRGQSGYIRAPWNS